MTATYREAEDAYDRQRLRTGQIDSRVADVIIKLEAERDTARADVTRLTEALMHAGRAISIRSARKRIREALEETS